MRLSLNIKPIQFEGRTKKEVMRKAVGARCFTVSSFGAGYASISSQGVTVVRVFNLEKRRKRVQRSVVRGNRVTKVLRRTHWVCYAYDFPSAVLTALGVAVMQGHRTFTVVNKRGIVSNAYRI